MEILEVSHWILLVSFIFTILTYSIWVHRIMQPGNRPGVQMTNGFGPMCRGCKTFTFHNTDGTICCQSPLCKEQWRSLTAPEIEFGEQSRNKTDWVNR